MGTPVSFPYLHLYFRLRREALTIGSLTIYWYGILIAAGMLLALLYAVKVCKKSGVSTDDLFDVVIWSLIAAIIGARLYYVLFYRDSVGDNPYFSNPSLIFQVWQGGLGIYGGVITAFVTGFIVCRVKKMSVGAVFDIAARGFLIGQAIGRWGNFINQEAYGSQTNLPWAMQINGMAYTVHPCFLYESLWCVLGFVLLHFYAKRKKFNGEIFLMYIAWYGFGRFFIEGLRTDSLMIGNIRVSQLVAAVLVVLAVILLAYRYIKIAEEKKQKETTYNPLFEEASDAVEQEISGGEANAQTDALAENEDHNDENDGENDKGAEGPDDAEGR